MSEEIPFRPCCVIPVYDHRETIGDVAARVRAYDLPVILVDDGSNAACARRIEELARGDDGIDCLRLERNSGKGGAFLAGARRALASGYSHALQVDADGQHDLDAVPQALARAREQRRALIAGVPRFDASAPAARRYGRHLTNVFVWLETWSIGLRDALCGFRVYPLAETVALANRYPLKRRMDFDIDIGVRLMWDGVPAIPVPVEVRYPLDGISHFDMRRDNLRIARLHTRLLLGMLVRAPLLVALRLRELRGQGPGARARGG